MILRSVRGEDHPMPAPRRAAFVFVENEAEEEEKGRE
jgi:hypothetical protein